MRYRDVFSVKRITMVHTWRAKRFRHHGPRAVPHPAASQQQPPCHGEGSRVPRHFPAICRTSINAPIQVRNAVVYLMHTGCKRASAAKSIPAVMMLTALLSELVQPVLKPAILSC